MRKAGVSGATASFRWCLVLTTTTNVQVDLRNESYGKQQQRSAHGRQEQYSRVLHHWLSTHPRVPITLVENSGDELLWAKRLAVRFNRSEQHLALVHLRPPSACRSREIGCFEAHSVHSAVKQSPQFRPRNMGGKKKAQCSHALMLTGRCAMLATLPCSPCVPRGERACACDTGHAGTRSRAGSTVRCGAAGRAGAWRCKTRRGFPKDIRVCLPRKHLSQ